MQSVAAQLREVFQAALVRALGDAGRHVDPLIRPATDPAFGDYQSNVAMGLAKTLRTRPRDVAQRLCDALADPRPPAVERCEIAGPGFINIHLSADWLAAALNAVPPAAPPDRLGIEPAPCPQTVVVDYSSPNVAKQMHVGHLRSTILGDSIARVLQFEGHRVIRQNHLGDWGTQFGLLIAHLKEVLPAALDRPGEVHVADLEVFYREATARAQRDPAFAQRARTEVVALHGGDPGAIRAWQYIVGESRRHSLAVYRRLGVSLTAADERGESFYNDRLPGLIEDLHRRFGPSAPPPPPGRPHVRVAESDGALCLFHTGPDGLPLFRNPRGDPLPMIVRKSDGAFLYATTDLAAVRFRIEELQADRIIYVTDARQAQHFEMLFAAARAIGWTRPASRPEVRLEHASFGSILGEDRRPLKTRSGQNVRLTELLDEAAARAEQLVRAAEADPARRRGFSEDDIRDIAEAVGIGAVKYADLAQNRQSDYVFSWDRMLALEGNTAPYLMYAYARIRSIYRKGAASDAQAADGPVRIAEPAERTLALQLLRFAETIDTVAAALRMNLLTDYLYQMAGAFMAFYESCPVLAAPSPDLRASRLALCDLTARTLRLGLDLLGIRTLERM